MLANSRTAQTMPTNNHHTTHVTDHTSTSRASSFADFELLYEINMARKIFFKPTATTHQLDATQL